VHLAVEVSVVDCAITNVITIDRNINDKVVGAIKTKGHKLDIALLVACGRRRRHLVVDAQRVACVVGQLRQRLTSSRGARNTKTKHHRDRKLKAEFTLHQDFHPIATVYLIVGLAMGVLGLTASTQSRSLRATWVLPFGARQVMLSKLVDFPIRGLEN